MGAVLYHKDERTYQAGMKFLKSMAMEIVQDKPLSQERKQILFRQWRIQALEPVTGNSACWIVSCAKRNFAIFEVNGMIIQSYGKGPCDATEANFYQRMTLKWEYLSDIIPHLNDQQFASFYQQIRGG
jgi:hypothetical protein